MGFGVKGKLPYKTHPSKIPTVVMAKRTEHSRKPIEFYDIIETTSYAPYVEVFSRKTRTGWDSMGNEVGKFDEENL